MSSANEQYIISAEGQRVSVVVEFEYYQKLLSGLEELEEIYAFDLAVESENDPIPLEQALSEI